MRKDFKNIDIYAGFKAQNGAEWQKENQIEANWKTPEQIDVKPVYTTEQAVEQLSRLRREAGHA